MQRPSGSNNSIDSGCYGLRNGLDGTGAFLSKIGIHVNKELVKVKLNKKLITTNNDDMASSSIDSSSCGGFEDDDCVDGVVERECVKINKVECATFAHGFGLR